MAAVRIEVNCSQSICNISDLPPSIDEMKEAIMSLKNGKAPGDDGLTSEIYKSCRNKTLEALHQLLVTSWSLEEIPNDWDNAILLPLYKKGDRKDCKNYRGIFLLNLVYKIIEKIILRRIINEKHRKTRENQAGFRPGRGYT